MVRLTLRQILGVNHLGKSYLYKSSKLPVNRPNPARSNPLETRFMVDVELHVELR